MALAAEPFRRRQLKPRLDGKYVTIAGVSAGIDMALTLTGRIAGDAVAQEIQLAIEYDPQPPYETGVPGLAPQEITERLRASSRFGPLPA